VLCPKKGIKSLFFGLWGRSFKADRLKYRVVGDKKFLKGIKIIF